MVSRSKDTVRQQSIEARSARETSEIIAAGNAIAAHDWNLLCPGQLVTCFVAMATEPPTSQLLDQLRALGKSVALPVMQAGNTLAWGYDDDSLTKNSYGILEPNISEIDLTTANAIIIPALRVGLDGTRLGRGAGYYDRALASLLPHSQGGPLRICLVFDDEVDESVPSESHDAPIDVIVTPTKVTTVAT
jgi:5-formyltetrahydrofolate cyclo-ligase